MRHSLFFSIIFILFLMGCSSPQPSNAYPPLFKEYYPGGGGSFIEFRSNEKLLAEVRVEIANSPEKREQGLMFQESLPKDAGMFFIFENSGYHSFWMKNTLIPLDIIFIDKHYTVVDILTAEPCTKEPCPVYTPKTTAQYVLEVPAGYSAEKHIQIGNAVTWRMLQ